MLHIVLFQPEIPPNTGNVLRLAANTGCIVHLVRPLGFRLNDRSLARAGMDYRHGVDFHVHDDWQACLERLGTARMFSLTTRGVLRLDRAGFAEGDVLLFGSESRGLPEELHAAIPPQRSLRIPMRPGNRSLNLANAVAVTVYEAWRQLDFAGAE